MKAIFLFFLSLCPSCGSYDNDFIQGTVVDLRDPRTVSGVDSAFASYYQDFQKDCNHTIDDVPIGFEDLEHPTIGLCTSWQGMRRKFNQIQVDGNWWKTHLGLERKWLVYHELGHCVLDKGHDDSLRANGEPKSIMISFVPGDADKLLKTEMNYYVGKLCK